MQTNDPTGHVIMEDLSDRSENSHSEFKVNGFQDYDRIKELNLSLEKIKDEPIIESKDFHFPLDTCRQRSMVFDGFSGERNRDHSVSLEKSKDFTLPITKSKDPANYPMDRSSDADSFLESLCKAKDSTAAGILFNFTRDGRQKSLQTSLDRNKGPGITTDREIKGFGMLKNNLSIDRINEFNMYLDRMRDSHIGNIALDRIPQNALLDAPSMLESNYFRNFQMQPRSPDLETITLEGMRRSHLSKTERSPQNLATQLPHSITHMQHSQQQQQQQQPKSFTIDYILGHKNNPREKHQRGQQQQFRKHQGLENSAKNGSSSTSSAGPGGGGGGGDNRSNGGGKSKRVRTIFTAEQLEKLEGEFARQQYMVGPERQYLAHALRLTEAQVKVWFQNRRIKWRKHHHEQQSQQLREIHQRSLSSLEHEDCDETGEW